MRRVNAMKGATMEKFPAGGKEVERQGIRKVEINLQRAVRDASSMPERALEIRPIRKTLESLAQTLERNGIDDERLEKEGLPRLHEIVAKLSKDNGITTEKLAESDPGIVLLALAFGAYFRQSTWANFSDRERLLTTTRNVYEGAAIEFSWGMTKIGPRASFTNTPDLGDVMETVLVEKLISSARAVSGKAPAGILVIDESASMYDYSKSIGGGVWSFDNSGFRSLFMRLLEDGGEWKTPVVFVSQELDHDKVLDLHGIYLNDHEHHRVSRTRRILYEAAGDATAVSAPLLTALMDSRIRALHRDHKALIRDPEAMRKLHGSVISMRGCSKADSVNANDIAVHVTKIGRPGELSASSLGTETGHGVPVIGFKGGLRSRPQIRIVPEADLLEEVGKVGGAELTEIRDKAGNFMAYYLGPKGESPSESDVQEMVPKSIDGPAMELKSVRSVGQVISDVMPSQEIMRLKRDN